jgi:hypothetical protein
MPGMEPTERRIDWDERVRAAFGSRYEGSPRAVAYYIGIWAAHLNAGMADPELVSALTGDDECARRQRIWEMQLAAHLKACGHVPGRRPEAQPDYRIEVGGTVVWVEGISPAPGKQVPQGWLDEPASAQVNTVPYEWALSRWTAALKEKQAKGVGYELGGVIKPGEAYVVAIEGGQLSRFTMSHGASRLPLALEATFPIGPLAFCFENGGRLLGTENILRFSFTNHNGAEIRTEPFLHEEFSNVSAVLGCSPPMFAGPELPVQVVYNPLARVPVVPGTFGKAAEEWHAVAVEDGGERFWQVERCG